MKLSWLALCAIAAVPTRAEENGAAPSAPAATEAVATTSVGMVGGPMEQILPGSELEVAPIKDAPIVIRILETYKHGDAHRYSLSYYGLEAGTYDLTDYLRRKDGSPTDDLPAIRVVVESILPAGQIEPTPLEPGQLPRVGGYRRLLVVAGALWLVVLFALLFARKRRRGDSVKESRRKRSLAEQLRPLVESAVAGRSTPAELAALEHALLVYWRKRLGVAQLSPAAAIAALKENPAAAALLVQLESWLHRPGPPATVDVAELLRPYQDLPTGQDSDVLEKDDGRTAATRGKEPAR